MTMLYTLWRGTITYYCLRVYQSLEVNNMIIVPTLLFYIKGVGTQNNNLLTYYTMEEPFICNCRMKTDLENTVDVFSFFEDNYPLSGFIDNMNKFSDDELRCGCCLMATALARISRKTSIWERLKVNNILQHWQ